LADAKDELRAIQASHAALDEQLAAQREREEELARRDDLIADELEDLRATREDLEADKRALEDELVKTEDKLERERADREREIRVWSGRVDDAERTQARAVEELEQVGFGLPLHLNIN
jgi:predicted  nucleic acid-binding Zn-ribbon protein